MLKTIEQQVRYCLEEYPETRNSDIALTIRVWKQFYTDKLVLHNDSIVVDIKDLFKLPREDNVKRIRAHIQNDLKQLLPTNWATAKKRHWLQHEWKKYLGFTPEAVKQSKIIDRSYSNPTLLDMEDVRR